MYFNLPGIKSGNITELEKSIAVLPFINDSREEDQYVTNGIWDRVIINLQEISDLRVPGRSSLEQYRNTVKSIPEIAREMNVNYIVRATVEKYGNTFILSVQLFEAALERIIWKNTFQEEIESPKDYVNILQQIAESITAELKVRITDEERKIIGTIPTSDTMAFNYYLLGKDYYNRSLRDEDQRYAIQMYEKAIAIDSGFALAWAG